MRVVTADWNDLLVAARWTTVRDVPTRCVNTGWGLDVSTLSGG